jgi:hypothetical protein
MLMEWVRSFAPLAANTWAAFGDIVAISDLRGDGIIRDWPLGFSHLDVNNDYIVYALKVVPPSRVGMGDFIEDFWNDSERHSHAVDDKRVALNFDGGSLHSFMPPSQRV